MTFEPTEIDGAFLVSMEAYEDERGWFARAWCENEFVAHGLDIRAVQTNVSFNHTRGTIRGLHWQVRPYEESKLLRCTRGEVFDVMVDVRKGSPTYGRWQGFRLAQGDRKLVYVPEGCAHGYQALTDGAEVTYNASHEYVPNAERGIRWNDPTLQIDWPVTPPIVSEKDASWPDFSGTGT